MSRLESRRWRRLKRYMPGRSWTFGGNSATGIDVVLDDGSLSRVVPSAGIAASRSPIRRRIRATVAGLLLFLAVVFSVVTASLFVWPATGMPARVGAIVVPGGVGNRVGIALALARAGRARYLVLSQAQWIPPGLCGSQVRGTQVICFKPSPATTQGEAEAAGRLARRYRWQSIVVVTTPDQLLRAELRFRRCVSVSVYGVTTPLPWHRWPYAIAYQWAATVKAELVNRAC